MENEKLRHTYSTKISKYNNSVSRRNLINRKKFISKIIFLYIFFIEIWKCQNRRISGYIANLWFPDKVQNFKTRFVEKYGPNWINVINKIVLYFDFTVESENLIQIGSLVTEIQNFGDKIFSSLYDMNLFKRGCPI